MAWDADRVALAVDESGIGCWVWCTKSGEIAWNSHMYTLFDKEPSSGPISYEADFATRLHPDDFARISRLVEASVSCGTRFNACYRVLHRDGSAISIMACGGESVEGSMVGTCVDVTKLLTTKLHESGVASSEHPLLRQ
ncbi:hypothetical protein JKP88DRAFT_307871 [Tribonema minus]|uniref:PAS fold-3 domain-containing protein n=1 Tax=Tribonema minus TaxID=303371 RepID=A0A836CJ37_9STRA|nr:hypothetical protein JKP88DRAFT_307871 [Tribonema minus]